MLKTFTGFKGKCAFAQVGNLKFAIIAKTDRELQLLWDAVMEEVPLDPRGIKAAILIEASTLPDRSTRPSAPTHEDALDRLNESLEGGQGPAQRPVNPITHNPADIEV